MWQISQERLLPQRNTEKTWSARRRHGVPVVSKDTAYGFTGFQFLAAVLVAGFTFFMVLQYVAANRDSVAIVSAPVAMATTVQADARPISADGAAQGSGATATGFVGDTHKPLYAGTEPTKSAAVAQHAEWVDNFYAQLNSPQPSPVGAEDTAPVISGRVLTQAGWPVEGVKITAQFRNYFKASGDDTPNRATNSQQTTTNSNGFYAFRNLPAGIYLIGTGDSGGYAPVRIEVRTGVKYADLVLTLQSYAQVTGVVTDTVGNRLERVHVMPLVKGIPAGAVSDSDGEFKFAVALEGKARSFPVRFQLPGYREQRYQITETDTAEDGSIMLAVTMEPVYEYTTVSGSVKDADGVPVAGDTVRLYSPSLKRNYRAVVDYGGEFLFSKIDVADDYQLWIRPTGPYRDYTEQNVELTAGHLWRDIELEHLNRNYRLSGRILDQGGEPVPNFTLTGRSKSASGQKLEVTSDRHGRYEVENVPEGALVFESRTRPYYTVSGLQLAGSDTDRDLDLVVNRGKHKLLGKVVDSNGRPIASPRIRISASNIIDGLRSQLSSSTSADFDGRFLFTELGAGQHTVTVNAPGYEGVRAKPVVGNQKELVVELEKSST
ncbi:MAG: carboxypeptidase regulatory-like domain-containing protein [Gammaproteobacteria bacterium]|nr:carboxypeptidase regulatory-like domain-containing protein [Gammaproteobacteria bacterium]